jgi:hypothetical protein
MYRSGLSEHLGETAATLESLGQPETTWGRDSCFILGKRGTDGVELGWGVDTKSMDAGETRPF